MNSQFQIYTKDGLTYEEALKLLQVNDYTGDILILYFGTRIGWPRISSAIAKKLPINFKNDRFLELSVFHSNRKFANIPEGTAPDEMSLAYAQELLAKPSGERELGIDPETGYPIVAKSGRYGPYITEIIPAPEPVINPKTGKPKRIKKEDLPTAKTASLFSTMDLDTITYEDALKLLSLPRVLGTNTSGEEITVQNGRYGPYLKAGTDSRTLTSEDQIFVITLPEALEIYAKPKERRRGAKPPLKDFGVDPVTGKHILVKDGRFGMYVTDGETNATLRRGDTVEAMTIERAQELLAGRRAWELENGGAPKKKSSKKSKKKAPTLTEKTISDAGAKRKAKRSATGKAKKSKE